MTEKPELQRETEGRLMEAANHHIEAANYYEEGKDLGSSISSVMAQGCVSLAMNVQLNNNDNFLKVVIL